MKKKLLLLLCAWAVLLVGTPAWADFYVIGGGGPPVGTKITSLPYTINNPGFYFLDRNLTNATPGHGITVNVDNVTIDLMGFALTGTGISISSGNGVHMANRNNVEIRNGTVCNFYHGIYDGSGSGTNHRVIGIRAHDNGYGIWVWGDGHLIQNCNASNNKTGEGFYLMGSGSLIGNIAYKNVGFGFNLGAGTKLVDRNTAYNNTGGNYSYSGGAGWGVNAGAS